MVIHVLNEENPVLGQALSTMPYEDARSIYDTYKEGNLKFKTDFKSALYKDSASKEALAGVQSFGQMVERIPEQVRLIWGETQIMQSRTPSWLLKTLPFAAFGLTEKEVGDLGKVGEMNVRTANRNLETLSREQERRRVKLSKSEQDSFLFKASAVGSQYAAAITLGLINPALSLGFMESMVAGGTAEEGLQQYKKEHPEDTELKGFSDVATKELILNAGKTYVNGVLENVLGAPAQVRRAGKMAELAKRGFKPTKYGALKYVAKNAAIGAAMEFSEEGPLQGTSDTVFDYMLGRYKDVDEAVTAWKQNMGEALYAGMFGGAFGMASAVHARAKGIAATREMLKNVVPAEDLDKVATVVFENELSEAREVAAVGLEISSQLNAKKGAIYDALRSAAFQAAKESGGYKGLSDESLWSHVNEVSERFAQEAVAESIKRNVPIQEVIESTDIVYKDGELHLEKADGESKLSERIKKAAQRRSKRRPTSLLQFIIQNGGIKDEHGELSALDAVKGRPGLVNNKYGLSLDHAREIAEEAGYFGMANKNNGGNTTIDDLLTLIDKELRGEKVYTEDGQAKIREMDVRHDESEEENFYERFLAQHDVDYNDLTLEEKKKAYSELYAMENEQENKKILTDDEADALWEETMFQESMDLAEEMDAIDANNDAYTGETININGVEKTVYNSNGDRIAKSEEALRAFYNWFGDSKVVDEQGRPLVVYHNSGKARKVLSRKYARKSIEIEGVFFAPESDPYGEYGPFEHEVYLRIENPADYETAYKKHGIKLGEKEDSGVKVREWLQEKGYDGVILKEDGKVYELITFEENQQKSTSNRGTYSLTDNNIYNQSAYHGTPHSELEGGKFSLEKMGTGEGAQVHGHGLYYTASYDIADERYRERLVQPEVFYNGKGLYEISLLGSDSLSETILYGQEHEIRNAIEKEIDYGKSRIERKVYADEEDLEYLKKQVGTLEKIFQELQGKRSKDVFDIKKGQVYEVDIPENPYLLDEQKPFSEQSPFVQAKLKELANDFDGLNGNTKVQDFLNKKNPTGKDIYEFVAQSTSDIPMDEFGIGMYKEADEAASKLLEKYGIKGITYFGQQDGRCFVIFNPDDVKVIQKFYQVQGLGKNTPVKRGSFDANSKVIKLFEDANTSTLPHELAHFWLDNMWTYANSGNASAQYQQQFNAVRNFLGVKPNQENLTRAQHEKFASGYEKYLYRGVFPNPIMGTVFANYERFIRDVYQSINDIRAQGKSKVRLTPEIIQFFDSMVSGELPAIAETSDMVNEAKTEQVKQYDSKIVAEVKKEIKQPEIETVVAPTTQEILPVGSSGEVKESSFAKRTSEAMGIENDLTYERANMEQERAKAAEMWKNDPKKAQETLNNATIGNDVLRSALYTEQQRIALENGDRDTFLKSLRKQSAEATRAGQELAALRGVVDDITMPAYWIRMAEWEAQKQLAKNMATYFDKVMGNTPLLDFTNKFDADVKALYEKVRSANTNAEKSKIMKDGLAEMQKTYRGLNQQELGELYQTDWTNEELAYDYVEKKARDAVGLNLTNEKANAIIQASRDLDTLSRKVDAFGIPTAQFFAKKSELEYLVNSHTPSSQTKVLLSTLGRANMLTAPATSVLNVASNVQNYGAQTLIRRLNNTITKHTNDNLVDPNLRKQYRKRVWDTFWATGYDLSMMNSITDTRLYRGESAVNSAGEGVIRQAGQWAEKHIFGELISSPDMVFKSYLAFTDFAGNEATDIAYKEGLTGDKAKARANELFTDAVKIEPTTEIGKQIRAKAQADALVITFQQDTKLARALLDLRNIVNKATGDVGVGDLLSAFVKTPANVLALGYDATVGPFGHLVNTFGAIQDVRAGNLTSARVMATLKQTTTMAVMQAIVAAFALGFIDDDDYIPDYSQLSPSERLIVKERGASFGSIRIGDTYISTDFFGPFEVPLTAWLNARRQQGFADSASAYIGSVLRKGLDAPVIKDLMDQAKAAENVGSDSLSIWEHIYDTAGNLLISRLTPNVMNTIAKMSDGYERETNRKVLNKLIARVPVLRESLEPKISVATGKPVETPSAFMQLFFGSRAHKKVDSAVADELYRLYQGGEKATLSDITKSGDLKVIDEKNKQSVKEWFAREYSSAAEKLIRTSDYSRKTDEEKKNALNKIRRDLVKQIKQKYKKEINESKVKK